jgi:hypothetical protein
MNEMHPSKKLLKFGPLLSAVFLLSVTVSAKADTFTSYTGTLSNPESVFETTFTLAAATTVTFQTWGFGGGTNASGTPISAGGFDPMIALFNGPVATATMYTDGSGNPLVDADNLPNAPWSYVGNCPPAGTVAIGTNQDCGDDFMQVALSAGVYTLVLTDADYQPAAIYDNGALSEGFFDLSPGVFQTCDVLGGCISTTGNYALDIVSSGAASPSPVPEPSAVSLLSIGLAALVGFTQFKTRRTAPHMGGKAI